ncbi:MAG: class I SAM-dependent RNA methyltransferase [Lentisphaeria bacterium]|nr:class I SAM-dependent RNA methyltransferase [Lentisphaeria bacterium]
MAPESRRIEKMNSAKVEVLVSGFAFGGRAVGRSPDGKVCFVRGAVPGEKILVRVTSDKKKYSEGVLEEVLEPSPLRRSAVCPNLCPGCSYSQIPYELELEWKQRQFRSFAEKAGMAKLSPDFLLDPVGSPVRTGWRNKIRLALEFASDGTVRAGYRGEDNKSLIPITDCPLAVPEIREVLRRGRWRDRLTGQEKNITFRWTRKNGVHTYTDRGKPIILTDELTGFGDFQTGGNSFFQVNPFMSGRLAAEVMRLIQLIQPVFMVELYCGCGCFSVLAAEQLPALRSFGVELDHGAVKNARINAERHGVAGRAEFEAGDSAEVFRKKYSSGLPPGTLLLTDPPRTGLDSSMRDLIGRSKAQYIIYVSCSPDTLFRDLAQLEKASYRIRKSRILDMFPSTAHFESITLCEHIEGEKT